MTKPVEHSEHTGVEEHLEESEEIVRALLEATGQAIYGVDLDGNCTFANPVCATMLGYETARELIGRNMHDVMHHTRPDGTPCLVDECHIYDAFREGRGLRIGNETLWRKDGTSFPVEYWSDPLLIHGELRGCVVSFVDISERTRAEEELRQSEKLTALGKMSAGLAHELNNPAAAAQRASQQIQEQLERLEQAAIRLGRHAIDEAVLARVVDLRHRDVVARPAIERSPLDQADLEDALASWLNEHDVPDAWEVAPSLAEAGVREDDLRDLAQDLPPAAIADALTWISQAHTVDELVETVATGVQSISELVGAVKEYSYMDRAQKQEIDVHVGIESTLRILHHKLRDGTRLVREFDTSLPRVFVPAGELNQVWTNLIDNAIDAAGPSGQVTIRTYAEDGKLVVEVADDGGGIPPGIRAHIFDPFVTSKEVGQGTGLGLATAGRIVRDRCNGEIDFESKPGDTRFRVRLPLQTPGAQA